MPREIKTPSLSDPGVFEKNEIINLLHEYDPDEICAIYKYCIDYHFAYSKAKEGICDIVTTITIK